MITKGTQKFNIDSENIYCSMVPTKYLLLPSQFQIASFSKLLGAHYIR